MNKKIIAGMLSILILGITLTGCGKKDELIVERNDLVIEKEQEEVKEELVLPEINTEEIRNDFESSETKNNTDISFELVNKEEIKINSTRQYNGTDFYYNQLSEKEKIVYTAYKNMIEDFETEMIVPKLTEDELNGEFFKKIYTLVGCDNPQLFVQPEYFMEDEHDNPNETKISFKYHPYWSKAAYEIAKEELDKELQNIYKKMDTTNGDYNKIQWLYHYLVTSIEYDLSTPWTTGMYGALVKKNCSCEGISEAFEYILNVYGIDAVSVTGMAGFMDDEPGPHKWSLVKLENDWYHFDVTWDIDSDLDLFLPFSYFAVTEDDIKIAHHLSYPAFLPKTTALKYNYYTYNNLLIDNSRNESIAAAAVRSYKLTPGYITLKFDNYNNYNNAKSNIETWLRLAFDNLNITKWAYYLSENEELLIINIGIPK